MRLTAKALVIGLASALLQVEAAAQVPAPSSPAATSGTVTSPRRAAGYTPNFRRFGPYDYLGTAVIAGGYYAVELTQENARSATLKGPLPLERAVRDGVAAGSHQARRSAVIAADWLWYASVTYPVLDAVITPAIRTGGYEVSFGMSLINFQSFMLASLLIRMPHKWLGRTRPDAIGCANDPHYSTHCGNEGLYASFPGGHVGVSMTGAGLSCAHHLHGKLYGSPLADGVACGSALTAAGLVGWLRMRSDSHWLSDQLVGTGIGLFSGYAVPSLLYYHPFWRKRTPAPSQGHTQDLRARVAALPWFNDRALGVAVIVVD